MRTYDNKERYGVEAPNHRGAGSHRLAVAVIALYPVCLDAPATDTLIMWHQALEVKRLRPREVYTVLCWQPQLADSHHVAGR